jgi:hypothetical protein
MYSCSYGVRNFVLLICFKSFNVLCIGPYSCLGYAARILVIVFYVSDVFLVT